MELNADFSKRALVHGGRIDWVASPMPGVDRRMLDRIGGEVARATTIVRYAPGSHFSPHVHTGGEEFLVLEGVFQDEHGDFPAGSYVRNPPETRHTPASEPGCVILVKLWQFDLQDRTEVRIRTGTRERAFESASGRPGVDLLPLHADMREVVRLETWSPNAEIELRAEGGIELFVLDGSFTEGGEGFERWSWLRLPEGAPLNARAGADGAQVWLKSGHLPYATAPARG